MNCFGMTLFCHLGKHQLRLLTSSAVEKRIYDPSLASITALGEAPIFLASIPM
jgi:hypothetical protein